MKPRDILLKVAKTWKKCLKYHLISFPKMCDRECKKWDEWKDVNLKSYYLPIIKSWISYGSYESTETKVLESKKEKAFNIVMVKWW